MLPMASIVQSCHQLFITDTNIYIRTPKVRPKGGRLHLGISVAGQRMAEQRVGSGGGIARLAQEVGDWPGGKRCVRQREEGAAVQHKANSWELTFAAEQ